MARDYFSLLNVQMNLTHFALPLPAVRMLHEFRQGKRVFWETFFVIKANVALDLAELSKVCPLLLLHYLVVS